MIIIEKRQEFVNDVAREERYTIDRISKKNLWPLGSFSMSETEIRELQQKLNELFPIIH